MRSWKTLTNWQQSSAESVWRLAIIQEEQLKYLTDETRIKARDRPVQRS